MSIGMDAQCMACNFRRNVDAARRLGDEATATCFAKELMTILGESALSPTDLLFAKFNAMLQDHSILDEIRAQESKVDAVEEKLYEAIFAMDMDLAHQAQMASFVEQICDVSDIIEDIADKIQIMLITRKA